MPYLKFILISIAFFNISCSQTIQQNGISNVKIKEIVIEPQNSFNLSGDFYNGLALVKKDNKYGFINKENKIIIS